MLLKLTLDTNAFIYAFDFDHGTPRYVAALNGLISHALGGAVNIALATAAARDLTSDTDEDRRGAMIRKLELFPLVPSPFRIGLSRLDGLDTLAGPEEAEVSERLEALLHPGGLDPTARRAANHLNDIDHLIAHKSAGRDIFVTADGPLIRKAPLLLAETNIEVLDPDETLQRVERSVNVALVARDFCEGFVRLATLFEKQIASLMNQGPSGDHQDEYVQIREALLRRWEALRTPFGRFRRGLPQDRNDDPLDAWASFRHPTELEDVGAFYERERFNDQIHDLLVWSGHAQPERAMAVTLTREMERWRTLLARFVAHLEASTRSSANTTSQP